MAASPFPISKDFSEMKVWVPSLTQCCIQTWNIVMFFLSQDFYVVSPAHPIQQTQCTWLNPLLMVWYYGWCWDGGGPCQPCGFVTVGCCLGLTRSPAVCGRGTLGVFSFALLRWAWGSYPHLLWCPLLFCSLSSCLVLPAVSLYNTVSYQKRDGAAQNLIPCWSGSTMLPTPFTCSALAVCALSLHHPWTPKEGCVHPHP